MIQIEQLQPTYLIKARQGKDIALNNLSGSRLNEGEHLAVLGQNGCGKSTLAKHLNALLLPDKGTVTIDGMDSTDENSLWQIRQKVGMVFQNPDNQLVATTVEEDCAFGPENLGLEPAIIRERVDEALAMVEMTAFKNKAPHLLSGGQKQRVAIAGIIAMRPKYIVFDSRPLCLTPKSRREVIQTMQKLNKEEHITIINITHYMEEAQSAADRIIVMDKGNIALTGTPREVFAQVDTLKKLRLDVPVVTELAQSLPAEMHLPHDILTIDELVVNLCRSELKNVSYIYQPNTPNESTALNNVSLTINDGEFIGIIGHTGSGKSTLVQLLCGLLAPTNGQVFIDGVDINAKDTPKAERKKHRLQVGMVFQYPEHQLFEETVIADIAFGPKNLGFAEKEARALAKSAMKTVGLSADLAKSSPFDLSGGQKRRVAIAGVLAMNPKYSIRRRAYCGIRPPRARGNISRGAKPAAKARHHRHFSFPQHGRCRAFCRPPARFKRQSVVYAGHVARKCSLVPRKRAPCFNKALFCFI